MAEHSWEEKDGRRIVRFLSAGPASVREAAAAGKILLDGGERGTISVSRTALADMIRAGAIARANGEVSLCDAVPHLASRHRDLQIMTVDVEGSPMQAVVNLSESPLGQLRRRRTKDGRPFLSDAEFKAGERLRADYTRGQIMPRTGANWVASVASGRRSDSNAVAELTEAALAARLRVERAISAVGPELSGVLVDVCCFLKGLELVEVERGWPVRSAKIVLKSALGALSRHYAPQCPERQRATRRVLHWGSEDYRPKID
jgi:hypothetical protein